MLTEVWGDYFAQNRSLSVSVPLSHPPSLSLCCTLSLPPSLSLFCSLCQEEIEKERLSIYCSAIFLLTFLNSEGLVLVEPCSTESPLITKDRFAVSEHKECVVYWLAVYSEEISFSATCVLTLWQRAHGLAGYPLQCVALWHHHHWFYCSNCARLGQWEPFQKGFSQPFCSVPIVFWAGYSRFTLHCPWWTPWSQFSKETWILQ